MPQFSARFLRGNTQVAQAEGTPLERAQRDLKLTKPERFLYQRHLDNLYGTGGIDNPDGSRSSLSQMSFETDGRTYNIPTVWGGKRLEPDAAIAKAQKEGLNKFPSYSTSEEAEARYQDMHDYMEQDTAQYFQARRK